MATITGKLKQKTADGSDILHPETDADVVKYSNTVGSTAVTTVKGALDTIITAGVGVTGVKGDKESSYRVGQVNITPANVGAVAANAAITGATKAKITYDSKGLVTGGADLAASDIPTLTLAKISDAGSAAAKGVATSVSSSSTNNDLATAKAVYDAIDALPEPMVFKGTLGTGGTITSLPSAGSSNEGHTYKVIVAGTYASTAAKVGDMFVSNGSSWILIPAGDDVEDTHRIIKVNGTQLLGSGISTGALNLKNGGNITVTGSGNDVTLGVASGYSIPSTSSQTAWSAKYDKPSGGIPDTDLAEDYATSSELSTTDAKIKVTNATVSNTGDGNAVTSVAITNGQIVATKGTTFLTNHQSLANYVTLNGAQTISGAKTFSSEINVAYGTGIGAKISAESIELGDAQPSSGKVGLYLNFSGITHKPSVSTETSYFLQFPSKNGTIAVTSDFANKLDKLSTKPTAGTYSAVTINGEGQVTAGGQVFQVINNGATPSVATGGLYFEKDA